MFIIRLTRQLRTTHFPYTTLFRSHAAHRLLLAGARPISPSPLRCQDIHLGTIAQEDRFPNVCLEDRKSTRLNSSHGYISYAVFCLKKKKIAYILEDLSSKVVSPKR